VLGEDRESLEQRVAIKSKRKQINCQRYEQVVMRDLDYLMSSPLLARIYRHCARLKNQARKLRGGSAKRRALERRIKFGATLRVQNFCG
jgi:hypothetical protein